MLRFELESTKSTDLTLHFALNGVADGWGGGGVGVGWGDRLVRFTVES